MNHQFKVRCQECKSNFAVWFLEGGVDKSVLCDNCIEKGNCFCTIDYDTEEQLLDEFGSPFPCLDYCFIYNGTLDQAVLKELEDELSSDELIAIECLVNFKFIEYSSYEHKAHEMS